MCGRRAVYMNQLQKRKRISFLVIALLYIIIVSGCSLEIATPESLITAPESNQELMQQKQVISKFLGKEERMIVPEENAIGTAYQYINLDDDEEKEIIVFYANKENNFILGFMILDQQDGEWQLLNKTTAYGTDIHYFSVHDLDNDNVPEFLLGVKTGYGAMKELYVYHLTENGLENITNEDRIAYDQIVLAELEDDVPLIVTARTDTTVLTGSSDITVYKYNDETISPIYHNTFDGYCGDMKFAKINNDTDGLYMAMRYNHYMELLLLRKTDEDFSLVLEQPMPYDYEELDDIELFDDINNDGILEINSLWEPENNFSNKPYQDYVHVWQQWNEQNGLQAISVILESHADGYCFTMPASWKDTLYYDFYTESEIDWVEFYYENEEQQLETVFMLAAVDRLVWDKYSVNAENTVVVLGNHPTLNKVYIADIKVKEFNGFQMDASTLVSCLQIEGGE